MMRPDSRAWLRLLSVAAWTTALVLGEDGSASSAGTLELLRAMQQQMNGMEQQMNGMESRIASLEADNRRLRAAPRAANADPAAESWAVGPLGNGRRLEQQSCCRWTNSGACPSADVTYKCTSLHEYLETKTTTHVFEDVSACPGSDPSALFQGESANVALSSGGSEVIRVPTPLKVIHPANCTGATMEIQLNTSVPSLLVGNLDVEGTLTVRGVDILSKIVALEAVVNAPSGATWVPLPLSSGIVMYPYKSPYYTIYAGIVFLHGCVRGTSTGTTGANSNLHGNIFYDEVFATLPDEAKPDGGWHSRMTGSILITIDASTGDIKSYQWNYQEVCTAAAGYGAQKGSGDCGSSMVCLDGLSFKSKYATDGPADHSWS